MNVQVKNENRRKSLKRRSIRLAHAKKALKERNANQTTSDLDLHQDDDAMKVVSGSTLVTPNANMSLISYNDFTVSLARSFLNATQKLERQKVSKRVNPM